MRAIASAVVSTILMALPASGVAGEFAACAAAARPPSCLAAAAFDARGEDKLLRLEVLIGAGAVEHIAAHPDMVMAEVERRIARRKVVLAGAALAAAAARSASPYDDPTVARLIAEAGGRAGANLVAVDLWSGLNGATWPLGGAGDPPGLTAIWDTILAAPPRDAASLQHFGHSAARQDRDAYGLTLSRAAAQRRLSANDKASLASILAGLHGLADEAQALIDAGGAKAKDYNIHAIETDIARARLKGGYDKAAAARLVATQRQRISPDQEIFYFVPEDEDLDALAASGARKELAVLADAYLAAARDVTRETGDRGDLYALASEALRLLQDSAAAASAAREGLAMIGPAVFPRGQIEPLDKQARRAGAVQAVYGDAPVIALYRAGAKEEALDNGYLTGWDRYQHGAVDGTLGDPLWLLDDKRWSHIEMAVGGIAFDHDRAGAARLLDALPAARGSFDADAYSWNETLGLLAAVAGRPDEARAHLAAAARAVDEMEEGGAFFAGALAIAWSEALIALGG